VPAPDKPGVADIDEDPNVELHPYSSPPCYAHEVDPSYFGFPARCGAADPGSLRHALRDTETAIAAISRALARP
jgi:hypothetical protein